MAREWNWYLRPCRDLTSAHARELCSGTETNAVHTSRAITSIVDHLFGVRFLLLVTLQPPYWLDNHKEKWTKPAGTDEIVFRQVQLQVPEHGSRALPPHAGAVPKHSHGNPEKATFRLFPGAVPTAADGALENTVVFLPTVINNETYHYSDIISKFSAKIVKLDKWSLWKIARKTSHTKREQRLGVFTAQIS